MLLLNSSSLSAQFFHRFEVNAGDVFATQKEQLVHEKGYFNSFNYSESLSRKGKGYSLGLSYGLNKIPLSVSLQYRDVRYELQAHSTDIASVQDDFNELYKNTIGLQLEYSFFRKSTVTPVLFFGVAYNTVALRRENIIFKYVTDYAHFEWGFDEVEVQFNSFGYSCGAMLKYRLSDKIGIYYKRSIDFIGQDISEWLEKDILFHSNYFGIYIRLSKRKYS